MPRCCWLLPLLPLQVLPVGPPLLLLVVVAAAQHQPAPSSAAAGAAQAAVAAEGMAWGEAAWARWGCATRLQDKQHTITAHR
jgi:hypothetical protein